MRQFTVQSDATSEKQKALHIACFFHVTKKKLRHICERFCNEIGINIAFWPLKVSSFFNCKDTLPNSLKSYIVYQFTCAGCKVCYTGETKRNLSTRIENNLGKDQKFHIYSHL